MLTIHVWPKWLKRFLLTHPLYKSPQAFSQNKRPAALNTEVWEKRRQGVCYYAGKVPSRTSAT